MREKTKIIGYMVAYGVGFVFSVVVGHWVTKRVVEPLHEKPGPPREKNYERLPKITGMLDRFLYTSAWLTPYQEFIGIWLLVKVARGWKVPGQPPEQPSETQRRKRLWLTPYKEFIGKRVISGYDVGRFNIFIIGNALCVIFGVLGGIFIQKILEYWPVLFN